jgi:hypothetical protein
MTCFKLLPILPIAIAGVIGWSAGVMPKASAIEPPLPPRAGGSRGEVCVIAPNLPRATATVWSDRPLFLWRGNASRIEVRAESDDTLLWNYTPPAAAERALYDGEPLQPGQSYVWTIFDRQGDPLFAVPFRLMLAARRDVIADELIVLEAQLTSERATPEAIARQRANYFAERQLWADVLRESVAAEGTAAENSEYLQAVYAYLCGARDR